MKNLQNPFFSFFVNLVSEDGSKCFLVIVKSCCNVYTSFSLALLKFVPKPQNVSVCRKLTFVFSLIHGISHFPTLSTRKDEARFNNIKSFELL